MLTTTSAFLWGTANAFLAVGFVERNVPAFIASVLAYGAFVLSVAFGGAA
jgi:hypothetical protein